MVLFFVIDSGLELSSRFDPIAMSENLELKIIARSQATQRKGRAGRTKPGVCYKLYTEKMESEMNRDPIVDIRKSDISGDFLDAFRQTNIETVSDARNFFQEFIEPPEEKFLTSALKTLTALNIITTYKDDGILTEFGKKVLLVNKIFFV